MANLNVKEDIELLFSKLEDFVKSKTVVGEPIKVGEVTLVPIINTSFGLGAGEGDGEDSKGNNGTGGGSGIGARIVPTAMLVIKDDNVELLPIKKNSGFEKLIDMVPDIVEKVNKENKESKKDKSNE